MPYLVWRYLLTAYLRVFILAVGGFVALLLLVRLKEIARFMAIASSFYDLFRFILYQIPHILPIAIPVSCLISALLLLQNLSHRNELTAMRANGISLRRIIAPVLCVSFFIALLNFFICSELTTKCSIKSKEILYEQSSLNPIQLLQRQNLAKSGRQNPLHLENFFVDMKGSVSSQYAKEVVLVLSDPKKNGLHFVTADKLSVNEDILEGEKVTLISSVFEKSGHDLLFETHNYISTKASTIASFMKSKSWHPSIKYYGLSDLIKKAKKESFTKKRTESFKVEIVRRLLLGFSALTFSFIGLCFGLEIGRKHNSKKILLASLLSLLVLLSFIVGKALKYDHLLSALIIILPQPFAITLACLKLKKISRGIE